MSLDVYLELSPDQELLVLADKCEENGHTEQAEELRGRANRILYKANITHNVNQMADAAGIYDHLWRPDELGITRAGDLVEPLRVGLEKLVANPAHFKTFNPTNGWGTYEGLVKFVSLYLEACCMFPDAKVEVSR